MQPFTSENYGIPRYESLTVAPDAVWYETVVGEQPVYVVVSNYPSRDQFTLISNPKTGEELYAVLEEAGIPQSRRTTWFPARSKEINQIQSLAKLLDEESAAFRWAAAHEEPRPQKTARLKTIG